MKVKASELARYNLSVIHDDEDGYFAVRYDTPLKVKEPKIYKENSWRHDGEGECFTLVVGRTTPRKVTHSIVIRRTSINHYEVTFTSVNVISFVAVKTMSAVKEFLEPLLGG